MKRLFMIFFSVILWTILFTPAPTTIYAQSHEVDGVPIHPTDSCVDLVQRYYARFGYPSTWNVLPAYQMFDEGHHPSELSSFRNGSSQQPQTGDVLVFDKVRGDVGHVAIITGVSNGFVDIVQQNFPEGSGSIWEDSLPISANNMISSTGNHAGYNYNPVRGWLHDTSREDLVLGETRTLEYASNGQIKFKVNSGGKFQVRLDGQTVLEGSDSGETDWRNIQFGKHDVQFWVQRRRVGFLDYFWQPNLLQPIAGLVFSAEPPPNSVPQKPITVTPRPTLGSPSLSSPGNSTSLPQNTDVTLSWNASTSATQFKVELWGTPYNGVMPPCDWRGDTFCHIGQMQPGTMSWHVKARNGSGLESDWSDTWSFTIGQPVIITITPTASSGQSVHPPDQFNLVSPFGNQSFRDGALPNLQWKATTDPDGDPVRYKVIIDNANSPDARLPGERNHIESDWLTVTNWQPSNQGLEIGGRYTWYVSADDYRGLHTESIDRGSFVIVPHRTQYSPCPAGIGPGPTVYKAGDYDPNKLSQQEKNWLWHEFGHDGDTAPDGYGGERCGEIPPVLVVPPPPTNVPTTASVPSNTPARPISPTPTNTVAPPTHTPTFTPIPPPPLRPCPQGTGPGPTVYRAGSYDPNKITQVEKNWLFYVFGHGTIAPDGYGGEQCQ